MPSLTPTPVPQLGRDEPSLLRKACAGPSPECLLPRAEGCGWWEGEGKADPHSLSSCEAKLSGRPGEATWSGGSGCEFNSQSAWV